MADDFGEKTEPPTPRRRSEARSGGQVAKSQDLNAAVLLLASLIALCLFGPTLWYTMVTVVQRGLGPDGGSSIDAALIVGGESFFEVCKAMAPILLFILLAALVVLYAQVGWLITFKPLMPNLNKLNPLTGLKRLFSAHTLVQFAQNVLKLALVTVVAWLSIRAIVEKVMLVHTVEFAVTFWLAVDLVWFVGIRLAIILLLLAFLDFAYQRYRHEKQLKMTKEEVKEEMKRMEGDPVIKRRRREVQLKLAMQRIRSAVPKADVVVTNPTHYAVALRYEAADMPAPKVVAKGVDFMAQQIREVAAGAGVPIVQKPELARALYRDVDVGFEIPERFYRAVAEVLAYVYELSGRSFTRPKPAGVS